MYSMTMVEVSFRYGLLPGEREMSALDRVREVYGIRRIRFSENEHVIIVEYDATRMNADSVASLLRGTGMDVKEKLALV
jgi:hypothetical protein